MKEDRDFVTALARGVQVLQCFTAERPELGTTQIAALVGLPQSTVWRLCHTLTKLGLLVPGREAEKLRAGPAVLTLGHASVASAGLAELAYRPMKDIADRFGVNSHTVRRALAELTERGLVRAERGSGTYVETARIAYPIRTRTRFSEIIGAAGRMAGGRLLSSTREPAPRDVALRLDRPAGT